jgi:hypothetical protein
MDRRRSAFPPGPSGIDLAGQPLLGFAKYIAHDISGNLIGGKTLAFGRSKASEMRAPVKNNRH